MISATSLAALMFVTGPPAGPEPSGSASLTIVVDDAGTRVHNKGSSWVSVTPNAPGKTTVVSPGAKEDFTGGPDVQQGPAPTPPPVAVASRTLAAPSLQSPNDGEKVKLKTTDKGPGQVTLTWTPVAGAREYEVEYTVDKGKAISLRAARAEAKLPPIPSGKVAWAVRSVGEGATSEQSARRWFELQTEDIKLDVKPPTGWK
ncbi:MAG TPA: hypothetical protein VIG99_17125 [Myxococcaceae bacterium]|jgi:hypothetical protein